MIAKLKYLLIFIASINFLLRGTSKQGEAYEYFLKAEYEILQKNYRNAEKHYIKALSLAPDSPTILISLVDIKSYQGKYLEAIQYLEKIMELEPDNKDAGLTLYELYIQEKDTLRAELLLNELITYYPGDQDILFSSANTQLSNQNWSDLLKTYRDIYLSNPDEDDMLIKIYQIGITTGNIELVREILWELKTYSNSPIIFEFLIEIANNGGEYDDAIDLMNELIELTENTDELKIKLSELLLKAEHFDKVIDILEPVYETSNYPLDILRMLLISSSMLGLTEKEIKISETLINEFPNLSIGYEALSFSYLQSGLNEKAVEVLLEALSKFPNSVTFPFTLATILISSGDYSKAKNYFHHALSIQPDFVLAQRALAIMYEDMHDTYHSDSLFLYMIHNNKNDAIGQNDYAYILSERRGATIEELNFALELAENSIKIEPDNAAFLDTIGWIYYKLGTYHKAEEYIKKSLNINNNNPVILEHLGDIYVKMNKSSEAITIYEKVLLIDSDNQLIKNKINKIYE